MQKQKTMKFLSILSLSLLLFSPLPGDVAAFVQNNAFAVTKRSHHNCNQIRHSELSLSSSAASSTDNIELVEAQAQQHKKTTIWRKHPAFHKTNAISKLMPVPHAELWRKSLPTSSSCDDCCSDNECSKSRRKSKRTFWDMLQNNRKDSHDNRRRLINDVSVQFDNPTIGARQLLEKCGIIESHPAEGDELPLPEVIMAEEESVQHLTSVLSYFQRIAANCGSEDDPNQKVKCIARVVSTKGSSGVKCPRWHVDHVPVRLVLSIVGPGCEYIPETFGQDDANKSDGRVRTVDRSALNNLDEEDTMKANNIIVPPKLFADATYDVIKHAKEGDAILLMGRAWEEDNSEVLAAVHRSPTLKPNEERILLTVDLVDW